MRAGSAHYALGNAIARLLPRGWIGPPAEQLARLYGRCSAIDAAAVGDNLRAALPGATAADLRRLTSEVFARFSAYLVDLFYAQDEGFGPFERRLHCEGLEHLDRAIAQGRGAVVVSAHLGHWERAGMALARLGYPIKALAVRHRDPAVERFFERRRRRHGLGIIHLDGSLSECYRHLGSGGILGVNADRLYGEGGVPVRFLERTVRFPQGPARIAARCAAPVVTAFMTMGAQDRLHLRIGEELPRHDAAATTEAFARRFERMVREHPTQWFLFQRYWEAPQWPD